MKAAVVHVGGSIHYKTVDDPRIKDKRDTTIKVTATPICGSDLHIYRHVASISLWRWNIAWYEYRRAYFKCFGKDVI